ncbi:hypothetical protein V8F33_008736 [Rhypophila sp. PSN 637]
MDPVPLYRSQRLSIVCKGKELYRSTEGLTREFLGTQTVTLRLKELAANIKSSQAALRTSGGQENLDRVCADCMTISDQLLAHLQRLKVPEDANHRRWKSCRQALKSVWSKDEIDAMAKRLSTLREELTTEILVATSHSLAALSASSDASLRGIDGNIQSLLTIASKADERSGDVAIRTAVEALTEVQTSEFRRLCHQFVVSGNELRAISNRSKKAICDRFDAFSAERAAVVESDTEKRVAQVRVSILNSLRFDGMEHRFESIAKPHEKTFHWIFQDPKQHQKPWSNFFQWLEHEPGVYWLHGKPGSGKSTLLSYIVQNRRTGRYLHNWAANARLIQGSFFFWNSGSLEQRSHQGLYRTLLYEMLAKAPDLLPKSQSTAVLFIDGLDEAEGDAQEIAEFIHDLSEKSSNVKFCVSSRPWPVFETIFDESPPLRLQDLTRDDIKTFVTDRLWVNKSIQRLLKHEPGTLPALANEIAKRASGVFLWVSIVVKSLTRGIRDGDSLAMLWRRVEELPADMESLYLHILNSIQQRYPEESSQIFQMFRASGNTLDVLTLSLALRSPIHHHQAMICDLAPLSRLVDSRFTAFLDGVMGSATRFLNSRCQGLLEVADCFDEGFDDDGGTIDGLLDPEWPNFDPLDLQPSFLRQTPLTPPRKPLLIGAVLGAKTCPVILGRKVRAHDLVSHVGKCLQHLDIPPSDRNFDLIEELDRALSARLIENALGVADATPYPRSLLKPKRKAVLTGEALSTMVQAQHSWYRKIKRSNEAISCYVSDEGLPVVFRSFWGERFGSPLAFALRINLWESWLNNPSPSPLRGELCPEPLSLLEFVLSSGENPRYVQLSQRPLWAYVIHFIHILHGYEDIGRETFVKWLNICKLMVHYGADPYACCLEDLDTMAFYNAISVFRRLDPTPLDFRYPDLPEPGNSFLRAGQKHERRGVPEKVVELSRGCAGRARRGQSHLTFHSLEAVVQDVFVKENIPGAHEFLEVIRIKKSYWGGSSGLGLNFDKDEKDDGGEIPRWVS